MTVRASWAVGTAIIAVAGGLLGATSWSRHDREASETERAQVLKKRFGPGFFSSWSPDAETVEGKSRLPTGAPPQISCEQARAIVAQSRGQLAARATPVDAVDFAEATADWLDPHGFWSAATDTSVRSRLLSRPGFLLKELEDTAGPCREAEALGRAMSDWMVHLRASAQVHLNASTNLDAVQCNQALARTPFEDGVIKRSAMETVESLVESLGHIRSVCPSALESYVELAKQRFFPDLSPAAWSQAVLAAAVRGYVPLIDAHGAWAPYEEEVTLYDLDLETAPPARLWSRMNRVTLGIRIDEGALTPLQNGDVVLKIQDTPLAGMSLEQMDQLGVVLNRMPVKLTVIRGADHAVIDLVVPAPEPGSPAPTSTPLQVSSISYGDGTITVVAMSDVPDDLGDRVLQVVASAKRDATVRGILLDLRGNGGGSTDGAIEMLSLFLPDVPLFPMRRRDGVVEVERSIDVPVDLQWRGPVSVLVDGDSASAAEMIAGALSSYHRGPIVGARTFGKGCAQEYLDDDAHAGVLRLTTLVFCRPDGSAIQRTGVTPNIELLLPGSGEREGGIAHALPAWSGPDVRERGKTREVLWPAHHGHVGPCQDEVVCNALRALGSTPAAAR